MIGLDSPVLHLTPQRGQYDCALAALAMLVGRPYEDVLEVAVAVRKSPHRRGMWVESILRVSERLGVPLSRLRRYDFDRDSGILIVELKKNDRHAVVLKWGLIFDPSDVSAWEPDAYLSHVKAKARELIGRRGAA